jgi:hypothetical protein
MCRMGKLGAGLLATAVYLSSGAALAHSPSPRGDHPLLSNLPAAGVRSDGFRAAQPLMTPVELVASSGPLDQAATYARAERRLLERTWGSVASSRDLLQEATEEDNGEAPDILDGRVRIPLNPNDLDGDGRDDVAFFDVGLDQNSFQTDVKLTAMDGVSGQQLWSEDLGDPFNVLVFSPGDITGDDAEDLLVVIVNLERQPKDLACVRPTACTFDDNTIYTWDVALVSGPDAEQVWTRSILGSVRMTGGYALNGGPLVFVARHTEAVNALFDIRPSDDVDGDGVRDFIFNLQSYSGELAFHQWISKEDFRFTTDAEVLSGATGDSLFSRSVENNRGAALLTPAGENLLWSVPDEIETPQVCAGTVACARFSTMKLHLELIQGSSLEQGWTADIDDFGIVSAAPVLTGEDLDGDEKDDVVVGIRSEGGTESALALSGADGSPMWSFESLLTDPPTALGSIDGGVGTDLLFWEGWEPTEEEAPGVVFRIRLRRVDGATGSEIFGTEHDLLEEQDKIPVIYAYPSTDGDEDGIPDIALATWRYSGWWIENGSATSVLAIESGRDGTELVHLDRDRKALLFTGGDWSTGGADDLLEGSTTHNDIGFRLSAIEMPGGTTLWSQVTASLYSAVFGAVRDTSGTDDVMFGRTQLIQEEPRRKSRIDILRGNNGQPLWGVGPHFQ